MTGPGTGDERLDARMVEMVAGAERLRAWTYTLAGCAAAAILPVLVAVTR